MKHYIIVKFKKDFDYICRIDDITDIFKGVLSIDGISSVTVKKSNSDRQNRYDLMIEIDMLKTALSAYDESQPHILWKEKYGSFIENKTIFDCD